MSYVIVVTYAQTKMSAKITAVDRVRPVDRIY